MPKRNKQRWPGDDVNEIAYQLVQRSTGNNKSSKEEPTASEVSRVMAALGRKGGKVGGKRRLVTMSAKERREIASKAAKARWSKEKP